MERKSITKREIERKIQNMESYSKMYFLAKCLDSQIDLETRKFVLVKLGGLYEERKMYFDAAKMFKSAADINTTYKNKISDFLKAVELYIRARSFLEADACVKRAKSIANESQRKEIAESEKQYYKTYAKAWLENGKKKHAMESYEKMLSLDLAESERIEVMEKLSELYEGLGKLKEYYLMRKRLER